MALEWNGVSTIIGRGSANVEFLIAEHHALLGSIAYQGLGNVNGPIAEIGYRAYTGERGLEGLFIGASLVGGALLYYPDGCYEPCFSRRTALMTSIALDAGYQIISSDQVVFGFGLGVAYQHADRTANYSAEHPEIVLIYTGFLPRLLLSVGYAF